MASNLPAVILPMALDARGFRSGLSETQKQLQSFGSTMNVVGFRMGAAFAASFGAISAFTLKIGTDFETAMAGVRKTVSPAKTDFEELEQSLIDASLATGIAASELADLTRIGGQLGVEGTKSLAKFTDTIAKLSIAAAELTPEAAARGLARLTALTGESIDEVDKLASTLAFLGDKLPTTEERILNFSVMLAGMAKAANLSGEQLLGISAGFSAVVPGTERAVTAVQRLIQQMIQATAQGGQKLEEFGKVIDKSGEEFKELFEKDAADAIATFIEGLADLKEKGSDQMLASLQALDLQNLRTVQTLLAGAGAADLFRNALNFATQDAERHLKLEKEFAVQLATVASQFNILRRTLEEVGITLFNAFKDQILLIIDAGKGLLIWLKDAADGIAALPDAFKLAIIGAGALFAAIAGGLVVLGTLGGALVGTISLLTQAKTAFIAASAAVKSWSAAQMVAGAATGQMSLPLTGITTKTALFQSTLLKLVPSLKGFGATLPGIGQAAAAVGAGILVGVAAANEMTKAAIEIDKGTDDFVKKAVANAGIFATAWEGTKNLLVTGFQTLGALFSGLIGAIKNVIGVLVTGLNFLKGGVLEVIDSWKFMIDVGKALASSTGVVGDAVSFAFEQMAKIGPVKDLIGTFELLKSTVTGAVPAFDFLSDRITVAAEEYLKMIGQFPDPSADPITAAMRYQAEQLGIVIQETMRGTEVNRLLALAQQEVAAAAAAAAQAHRDSAEGQREAAEAAERVKASNTEVIAGMIAQGEETSKLSELSKFLNISQEELLAKIKELGSGFRTQAEATMAAKQADEEYKKSLEGLVTTAAEVAAKNQLLVDAIKAAGGAAALSRADIERLGPEFLAMAAAGETLVGAQQDVIVRFRELKASSMSTEAVIKTMTAAAEEQAATIRAAGGPFALHKKLLAENAAKYKAMAEAGVTLTDEMQLVIDLHESAAEAARANAEAEDELKAAAGRVASGMEDLRNASGAMTETAGKAFEEFAAIVIGVSNEMGPEMSEAFKEAVREMADALLEKFPQLAGMVEALLGDIGTSIDDASIETVNWDKQVRSLASTFKLLGMDASSAIGGILAAITATSKFTSDIKKQFAKLGDMQSIFSQQGLQAGLALGASSLGAFSSFWQATGRGGVQGLLAGTLSGASIGSMFGPWGTVIGAAVGFFVAAFRNKFSDAAGNMEQIAKATGATVGEELRKSIEQTAKDLDLTVFEASLLHMTEAWEETGGVLSIGMEAAGKAMGTLMAQMFTGAIPAGAALEQLGEGFTMMAEVAVQAGMVADAAFLDMVTNVRNHGLEIAEVVDFIRGQLEQAVGGVEALVGQKIQMEGGPDVFGGIQITDPQQAQAQADIFAATFFATLEEAGLRAAVESLGPAFEVLKEKIQGFGDVDLGGMERFFEIAKDPQFGPLLDGVQGLSDSLAGLANTGYLTRDSFNAFQIQGIAAYDQLQAAGLTSNEALQQMAPFLQNAIDASNRFGFAIDDTTAAMIAEAEASGIAFSSDPMLVMADAVILIAELLGASEAQLQSIGETAVETAGQMEGSFSEAGEQISGATEELGDTLATEFSELTNKTQGSFTEIENTGEEALAAISTVGTETTDRLTTAFERGGGFIGEQFTTMQEGAELAFTGIVESSEVAIDAVTLLGDQALRSASDFLVMADAAGEAAAAAGSAAGGAPPANNAGQFGLVRTVSEPTPFMAGEGGEETIEITPGGGRGGGDGGGGVSVINLQIDGKTIGRVIGNLSRTGDVRIHPDAVEEFG